MTKKKEFSEEVLTIAKSSFRYANLMKVKTKVEKEDHYEITFNSVTEYDNTVKEVKITYILPK